MEVSLSCLADYFDTWSEQISPTRMKSFFKSQSDSCSNTEMEWEGLSGPGAGGIRREGRAGDVALALAGASLGGAMAAVALGRLFVLRDRGGARAPWEKRHNKMHKELSPIDWAAAFDDMSGRLRGGGLRALGKVRLGGCSNSIRGEVWPFLLGLYDASSTREEREEEREKRLERYLRLRRLARVITKRAQEEEGRLQGRREKSEKGRSEKSVKEGEVKEKDVTRGKNGAGVVEGNLPGKAEAGGLDLPELSEGFSGFLEVSEPPSLEASESIAEGLADSFVHVSSASAGDSTVVGSKAEEASGKERGDGEHEHSVREIAGEGSGDEKEQEDNQWVEYDDEWEELRGEIPDVFKAGGSGTAEGRNGLESFLTWRRIMRLDAVRMNTQWVPFSASLSFPEDKALEAVEVNEIKNYEHLGPAAMLHAGRLVSILEAYAVHDSEIGYCQGMTDLLSPFVALIEDDSEAFACFARFMETARHNFRTDEVGIRKQLNLISNILEVCDPTLFLHLKNLGAEDCIFLYRMVIVLLRRELSFEQTIALWEVLWAEAATAAATDAAAAAAASVGASIRFGAGSYALVPSRSDFFQFVIASIVVSRRKAILACEGLDDVLRYCNSLTGALDVWDSINQARALVSLYTLYEIRDKE